MTREEAIQILKAIRVYECYPKSASEETKEAIDMAIEALQTEIVRCKNCKHRGEICPMRYIEMVGEDERIHDYSADNEYCSWGERKDNEDDDKEGSN